MDELKFEPGCIVDGEEVTEEMYDEFTNGNNGEYPERVDPSEKSFLAMAPVTSNSSMVSYTRWSPNYSSRGGRQIDTITIHHMAGNLSLETCGNIFAGASRNASATYAVDNQGRVGQYVDEKYAPWTTSSYSNDSHAVTIEVANSYAGDNWPVSDVALKKTIELVADICKRNNIKKLNYTGDTCGNLTMHCWFDSTLCPGPYLKSKFPYIAEQVNKIIAPVPDPVVAFDRIWGNNRYETAKAAANVYNVPGSKFTSCILASGENYADALSAGYLHSRTGGPILLINNDSKTIDKVIPYIKDNVSDKVYIVGGTGVIPESVEKKLKDYEITRYSGRNRYFTNLEVLKQVEVYDKLIVCYGDSFADGICAATTGIPVMLVAKKLLPEQINWLKEQKITDFYLIGGESVVSKDVQSELNQFGKTSRIYGSNRYKTSVEIAKKFFSKSKTFIMSTGKSFPDGLCAVNLGQHPLLLVDNDAYMEARKYVNDIKVEKAYVMGGEGTISKTTANWVLTKL